MINIAAAETENNLKPKLSVLGIGGAGCNAVNNMVDSGLEGVDFLVANTDAQSLSSSKAQRKIQLGITLTKGLGAGADPEVGKASAEESLEEIVEALSDSNMVFITAGMGGGTGSGAGPVIADALRERGILTVGVVTKPFSFEGSQRAKVADMATENMKRAVDTLIIIPNQNLFNIIDEKTTLPDAFNLADEVLHAGVSSITDLIVKEGRMNKDFADIREIVSKMGEAMMGTGEAEGPDRAIEAAEKAIANPLLDNVSMKGAKGVLLNITGSKSITLFEVDAVTNRIRAEIDQEDEAEFIIGTTIDDSMGEKLKVSIVATGMTEGNQLEARRATVSEPKIQRPFMDDDAQDITEVKFESNADEEDKNKLVQEDLEDEEDDIVIPVSLFSSNLEDDDEEDTDEEVQEASEDDFIEGPKEEPIVKISEDGSVIRPGKSNIAPVKEDKHEKEPSFFGRLLKKEASDKDEDEGFDSDKENFESVDLPDFLSRK